MKHLTGKILKYFFLTLFVGVIALCVYALTKPDSFRVERSITVAVPQDSVYSQVKSFHQWGAWSPWEKLDPAMKKKFSGSVEGTGAVYEWEGNSDVGKGRMEIISAWQPDSIKIKLDFLEPFEAHNTSHFHFLAQGTSTKVTWVLEGPSPFLSKVMSVFFNMDAAIGGDFERGLATLKGAVEKRKE